jgi:hypothetical protein
MKKGGITPRTTKCPKCGRTMYEDEEWVPPSGFDPRLHKFVHDKPYDILSVMECNNVVYKLMMSVPPNTKSLTRS